MKRYIFFYLIFALALFPAIGFSQSVTIQPDGTQGSSTEVSCGTSATLLLAANSKRRSWVTVAPPSNTTTVYVGFSTSVTTSGANRGIPLNANNTVSDNTYVGAIYCISTVATPLIIASTNRR